MSRSHSEQIEGKPQGILRKKKKMIDSAVQVLDMFRYVSEFSLLLNTPSTPQTMLDCLITIDCGAMSVIKETLHFMNFYKHF